MTSCQDYVAAVDVKLQEVEDQFGKYATGTARRPYGSSPVPSSIADPILPATQT